MSEVAKPRQTPSAVRKRGAANNATKSNNNSPAVARRAGGSSATMMKMYSDNSPGLMVDPITVLVFSLMFIGSVFLLHIWGKFTRG